MTKASAERSPLDWAPHLIWARQRHAAHRQEAPQDTPFVHIASAGFSYAYLPSEEGKMALTLLEPDPKRFRFTQRSGQAFERDLDASLSLFVEIMSDESRPEEEEYDLSPSGVRRAKVHTETVWRRKTQDILLAIEPLLQRGSLGSPPPPPPIPAPDPYKADLFIQDVRLDWVDAAESPEVTLTLATGWFTEGHESVLVPGSLEETLYRVEGDALEHLLLRKALARFADYAIASISVGARLLALDRLDTLT